ncbi:MAG TPA: hypothetical protein VNO55_08350 [Polyangia bacterium]|nr:hypothetical protein [Polyangia bacterium]
MSGGRDWLDDLGFRARNHLRWSAPAWRWPARSLAAVTDRLSPEARARAVELRGRYALDGWARLLSRAQLHENLYVLDVLDRFAPPSGRAAAACRGLDVGAKDGATAPARVAARPGPWDLVELDAHRRYWDLSTRGAHGRRFARAFPGCRYLPGSVVDLTGPYDLITWFLPFVRLGPLRAWGLPARCFEPARLLEHVVSLVAPGGSLLIVNQGEAERDAQSALLAALGLSLAPARLESPLSPFRLPRFLFRWSRAPA